MPDLQNQKQPIPLNPPHKTFSEPLSNLYGAMTRKSSPPSIQTSHLNKNQTTPYEGYTNSRFKHFMTQSSRYLRCLLDTS